MESKGYRVLVCGGRKYGTVPRHIINKDKILEAMRNAEAEKAFLREALDRLSNTIKIDTIIDGDARGADRLAGRWAQDNEIKRESYPVTPKDWATLGKAAGNLRNQRMLDEGKPTLVVAFPGGSGTADMVKRAKDAGIPVYEVKYESNS